MSKEIFSVSKSHILDNTEFWKENSEENYVKCIQDLIKSKPFGDHKFYIFSFVKRIDDQTGKKIMYHQPRLTRPDPVPGTSLMKVNPNDIGTATIIWTLPNQENFGLYQFGKAFQDQFVYECVQKFLNNRGDMIKPDPDDLNDNQIREIYRDLKQKSKAKKLQKIALEKIKIPS